MSEQRRSDAAADARGAKTRIVWVTFDCPPRQSSGVFRAIKLYKYLDKRRFEVDFITHGTAPRFARAVLDDSLLAQVDPTPAIYRVPTIIPHDLLPSWLGRLRRSRRAAGATATSARSQVDPVGRDVAPSPSRRGVGRTLYRWLAVTLYFPDHLFAWGWLAAFKALGLHARRRYDVVYTTSFPESAHLAGLLLHACGVRWIVDYRYGGPLWIKEVVGFKKPSLRQRLDLAYQRCVLRHADQVITQSEQIRSDFCAVFRLDPSRVEVLPSGYDEADFAALATPTTPFAKRVGDVHLMHVGTYEGLGDAERLRLVAALNALGGALRKRGHRLTLHAVGADLFTGVDPAHVAPDLAYQRHGVIVHRDVPSLLMAADCCLLSTWTTTNGGVKGFIPSKLWEYLRTGLPILTTGPKDEVWSIVDDAGVGVYVSLDGDRAREADRLAGELLDRMAAKTPLATSVSGYSWESRAQSLERLLLQMVEGRSPALC